MNITSKIVALSSAAAFMLQIALALLMLRFISPEEVGMFAVISQISFFWSTAALAQTPVQLLANHGISVFEDGRQAWNSSVQRFVWLLPFAALAVWFCGFSFMHALIWAMLMSLCQLTWILAQSMRLRMVGAWAQVGVRVLPPLMALLLTITTVHIRWDGPTLLAAALLGYAVGAAWLLPAFLFTSRLRISCVSPKLSEPVNSSNFQYVLHLPISVDNRSATLCMVHTLVEVLLATAILVVWQRLFGAQETGWISAPLRVMGFVPMVVHMAWAQVQLAQPNGDAHTNPLYVGMGGFLCVALLGAGCAVALEMGWLGEQWQGVKSYLFPLVVWQGSACFVAAYSHLPFKVNCARKYSWICIVAASFQLSILIAATLFDLVLNSITLLTIFSTCSSVSLLAISYWIKSVNSIWRIQV